MQGFQQAEDTVLLVDVGGGGGGGDDLTTFRTRFTAAMGQLILQDLLSIISSISCSQSQQS